MKAIADVLGSDKYFNLVDIEKFPMGKIGEMLELIIEHFRVDNNEPKMKLVTLTKGEEVERIGRSSRIVYSYNVVKGPGKKRNTKKKRKPKKKKSKRKKN